MWQNSCGAKVCSLIAAIEGSWNSESNLECLQKRKILNHRSETRSELNISLIHRNVSLGSHFLLFFYRMALEACAMS